MRWLAAVLDAEIDMLFSVCAFGGNYRQGGSRNVQAVRKDVEVFDSTLAGWGGVREDECGLFVRVGYAGLEKTNRRNRMVVTGVLLGFFALKANSL